MEKGRKNGSRQKQGFKAILIFDIREKRKGMIKAKEIKKTIGDIAEKNGRGLIKKMEIETETIKIEEITTRDPLAIIFRLEGSNERLRYVVPAIEKTFGNWVSTRGVFPNQI